MMPESDLEFLRGRSLVAFKHLALVARVKMALVVVAVGVCVWVAAILMGTR